MTNKNGAFIPMDSWGKYLRAKEPGVREKAYAWKTPKGEQVREQVGEQARTDAIRQLAAAIPHPNGWVCDVMAL